MPALTSPLVLAQTADLSVNPPGAFPRLQQPLAGPPSLRQIKHVFPPVDLKLPEPTSDSPDGKGEGTAQRGKCGALAYEITDRSQQFEQVLTTQAPTLWFEIQYFETSFQQPIEAEVSVANYETEKRLEPKVLKTTLPNQSGLFGLELPYELQRDRKYRWYMVFPCTDSAQRLQKPMIEGIFQLPQQHIHRSYK